MLVDPFVDTVLKVGCGLREEEIFCSSGEDTGVPSGSDLLHHVREQVEEGSLVIAIISSTFQTRPVCVAELGAAQSRTRPHCVAARVLVTALTPRASGKPAMYRKPVPHYIVFRVFGVSFEVDRRPRW